MRALLLTAFLFAASVNLFSQIPGTLSYQGILLTSDGITPLEGTHSIVFSFYTVSSGGSALFTRTISVTTSRGLYTCVIGGGIFPNAPFNTTEMNQIGSQQVYIGIKVDVGVELLPRAQLTTTAYTYQAQSAYSISDNAVTSAKIVDGTITNADINAGAAIADTKLATISTGSKVSNSATTATNLNTVNAIVARDASGNFSAGTITSNLTGNVTGNLTGIASNVTTNANLIGDITSVGNSTTIASGAIVDSDINASGITSAGKVSGNAITSGTIGGSTSINTSGNIGTTGTLSAVAIELSYSTPFIDFHFGGSAADYTSRIYEYASGVLRIPGNLTIDQSLTVGSIYSYGNIYSTTIYPITDNTYSLGFNGIGAKRWTTVYATGGVVTTSDVRLKENISDLKYGLNEILQMRPVSYLWKDKKPSANLTLGLIAQEVLKLTPEVVDMPEDGGYLGMNYSQLIPVLINGIKEQQAQIEELKTANKNFEKRLASLEGIENKSVAKQLTASKTEKP